MGGMERVLREPCPYLPHEERLLTAAWMRPFRGRRDAAMCGAARRCAQSLWRQGKTAQAILQLNRVLASRACWDDGGLAGNPYAALQWMLARPAEGAFMGNPVRHFQHLATRMSGEDAGLRTWRAWACFWISRRALDAAGFPVDEDQVRREGLVFPEPDEVVRRLDEIGGSIEVDAFHEAWGKG